MEESILKDFIIIRRDQFRSFESGEISYGEFITYIWLCRIADMYGYAHVRSYGWLAELLPVKFKANTVGVMMRSLRSHKFIDYSDRQGSRSGFKVTIGFWPVGKGKFRQLKDLQSEAINDSYQKIDPNPSQHTEDVVLKNHKSLILKNSTKRADSMASIRSLLTSYNNDIEKKKEKKNTSLQLGKENFDIDSYIPKTAEEQRCIEIAYEVGEESAGFIIGIYRKHGLLPIERAIEEYRTKDLTKLNNSKGFFNSLVMNNINLY